MAWSESRWFHYVRNRLYIERKQGACFVELLPRMCGYLLQAALNGGFHQCLRGMQAAYAMDTRNSFELSR